MGIKDRLIEGMFFLAAPVSTIYSRSYQGGLDNFMHGYAHDITLPFGMFFFNRLYLHFFNTLTDSSLSHNRFVNAGLTFTACSAMEFAQGIGLYHGTFDSKDFIAYAVGVGIAMAADALTFRKRNIETIAGTNSSKITE